MSSSDRKSKTLEALTKAPDYHLNSLELSAAALCAGATIEEIREALAARADLPRPLTADEEAALRFTIENSDTPDREALLAQLASAHVRGYCGCGCATVDLEILDPDAPCASDALVSFGDIAIVDDEDVVIGGVMIITAHGYLNSLELSEYGDGPIAPVPAVEQLRDGLGVPG